MRDSHRHRDGLRRRPTALGTAHAQETASLTSDYPVLAVRAGDNKLKFDSTTVSRDVAEGKKGMMVGTPVTATGNHGAVNYTLGDSGDAAGTPKFKIDKKTGQITTAVDLDYDTETEDNCRDANFCTVTVMASDASGNSATNEATVTIITGVDEKPTFSAGPMAITVPENSMDLHGNEDDGYSLADEAAATYTAPDLDGLNVNLTLMGPDAAKFSLSSAGVLSFKAEHDYEMPDGRGQGQCVRWSPSAPRTAR